MVRKANICGTCFGSTNAINLALKLADQGKAVCIYKEILHNQNVIDTLLKKDIECIDDLSKVDKRIVIIRAHGEPKETYDYMDKNNIKYVDATCKNVIKVHTQILDKYNSGKKIIIIGKKGHPEVIGSNGWCNNTAIIIETKEDIDDIKELTGDIFVICQTTFNRELALEFNRLLKEKFKCANIEFVDSICNGVLSIQTSSIELAQSSDVMFVMGGKKSHNSKELFEICSKYCTSYLVSSMKELFEVLSKHDDIDKNTNIGLTAGASTIKQEIDEYKSAIEFYLDYKDIKNKCIIEQEKFNNELLSSDENEIIKQALMELARLNSGGKFIRAYLISLGYRIFGGVDDAYLPLAVSYELFQTSILIHDDIIDEALLRRGKDTIQVSYSKNYNNIDEKVKQNLSNSQALCIGDLGYYLSNKILIDKYGNNKNISNILKEYNDIVIKTIKGEMIDVELPIKVKYCNYNKRLETSIFDIYHLKTSWYTIIGPFRLGMALRGSNVDIFDEMLDNIGVAFQIKDDILGIFGDTKLMGKQVSSDISEFKQTILYSYIKDQNQEYINELLEYYGKKELSESDIKKVQDIFIKSKALDYALESQEKFFDKSILLLDSINNIDQEYISILKGLISFLKMREK